MFASRKNALQLLAALAVFSSSSVARADDAPPKREATRTVDPVEAEPAIRVPAAPRKRRYLVHANVGILGASWTPATNSAPSKLTTLADRQTTLQMFGAGRFIAPKLRVTLSMQLAEAIGGAPAKASTLAAVGVVPWIAYHPIRNVFVGTGPLVMPRSYGKNQLDLGLFTTAGVTFPLGNGFAAGASVQIPVMFLVKTAVNVAPATFLAYRF